MKHTRPQDGFSIVPMILIFMIAFLAIGATTLTLVTTNYSVAKTDDHLTHAQLAADAGADAAIQAINLDSTWSGTLTPTVFMNAGGVTTTYESTVTHGATDSEPKTIDVTGRTFIATAPTKPKAERKIRVVVRGVGGGGMYSVVTGVGGLVMSNSSIITDGDVYVNGGITMSNTAQIGQASRSINVTVANVRCPLNTSDPTYPRPCAANENNNPIIMNNSSKIYGTVKAAHQTIGTRMSNPGLVAGTPPPAPLPFHDREAQKTAVTVTRTGANTDAGCNSNGAVRTWAANTKITGNVALKHKCTIVVQGNVWITGNLTFGNQAVMKVADGLTTPPVIMIDGAGGLNIKNATTLQSNSAGKGFRVITYWSATACSPDCTDVKGSDFQNSKGVTTILLDNSASGPNTEFYARWSAVTVGNAGNIGAVAGQTVNLTNSAAIQFGASVTGVPTVPSTWVVQSYRRMY
jgi:hypothetical protein